MSTCHTVKMAIIVARKTQSWTYRKRLLLKTTAIVLLLYCIVFPLLSYIHFVRFQHLSNSHMKEGGYGYYSGKMVFMSPQLRGQAQYISRYRKNMTALQLQQNQVLDAENSLQQPLP